MYKNIILPAGILAGTIIGAGVFALPYIFTKAGLLTGLFYLMLFGSAFGLIHLMYADIILLTGDNRRLSGYAEIYLGRAWRWLSALTVLAGMIFVLVIYLILSVSFVNLIAPNLPQFLKIFLFWIFASLPILWGVKRLAHWEFLITLGILIIILIIFSFGISQIKNLGQLIPHDLRSWFLPYGAILFSLSGWVAIPSIIDYFRKAKLAIKSLAPAIILGSLLPAALYFLFVLGVFGASNIVSEDSISGMIGKAPAPLLWALGILGLFAVWSTYIVILQYVKSVLRFDFGLRDALAATLTVFLPLSLYFVGSKDFLKLIELVGGFFMGLESIFITLIWLRMKNQKRKSQILPYLTRFAPYTLLIIFALGIILKLVG